MVYHSKKLFASRKISKRSDRSKYGSSDTKLKTLTTGSSTPRSSHKFNFTITPLSSSHKTKPAIYPKATIYPKASSTRIKTNNSENKPVKKEKELNINFNNPKLLGFDDRIELIKVVNAPKITKRKVDNFEVGPSLQYELITYDDNLNKDQKFIYRNFKELQTRNNCCDFSKELYTDSKEETYTIYSNDNIIINNETNEYSNTNISSTGFIQNNEIISDEENNNINSDNNSSINSLDASEFKQNRDSISSFNDKRDTIESPNYDHHHHHHHHKSSQNNEDNQENDGENDENGNKLRRTTRITTITTTNKTSTKNNRSEVSNSDSVKNKEFFDYINSKYGNLNNKSVFIKNDESDSGDNTISDGINSSMINRKVFSSSFNNEESNDNMNNNTGLQYLFLADKYFYNKYLSDYYNNPGSDTLDRNSKFVLFEPSYFHNIENEKNDHSKTRSTSTPHHQNRMQSTITNQYKKDNFLFEKELFSKIENYSLKSLQSTRTRSTRMTSSYRYNTSNESSTLIAERRELLKPKDSDIFGSQLFIGETTMRASYKNPRIYYGNEKLPNELTSYVSPKVRAKLYYLHEPGSIQSRRISSIYRNRNGSKSFECNSHCYYHYMKSEIDENN